MPKVTLKQRLENSEAVEEVFALQKKSFLRNPEKVLWDEIKHSDFEVILYALQQPDSNLIRKILSILPTVIKQKLITSNLGRGEAYKIFFHAYRNYDKDKDFLKFVLDVADDETRNVMVMEAVKFMKILDSRDPDLLALVFATYLTKDNKRKIASLPEYEKLLTDLFATDEKLFDLAFSINSPYEKEQLAKNLDFFEIALRSGKEDLVNKVLSFIKDDSKAEWLAAYYDKLVSIAEEQPSNDSLVLYLKCIKGLPTTYQHQRASRETRQIVLLKVTPTSLLNIAFWQKNTEALKIIFEEAKKLSISIRNHIITKAFQNAIIEKDLSKIPLLEALDSAEIKQYKESITNLFRVSCRRLNPENFRYLLKFMDRFPEQKVEMLQVLEEDEFNNIFDAVRDAVEDRLGIRINPEFAAEMFDLLSPEKKRKMLSSTFGVRQGDECLQQLTLGSISLKKFANALRIIEHVNPAISHDRLIDTIKKTPHGEEFALLIPDVPGDFQNLESNPDYKTNLNDFIKEVMRKTCLEIQKSFESYFLTEEQKNIAQILVRRVGVYIYENSQNILKARNLALIEIPERGEEQKIKAPTFKGIPSDARVEIVKNILPEFDFLKKDELFPPVNDEQLDMANKAVMKVLYNENLTALSIMQNYPQSIRPSKGPQKTHISISQILNQHTH